MADGCSVEMTCPECRFENRAGRKFCSECGAPLSLKCPACDFSNEPGEKFCGGCGTPLQGRPGPESVAAAGNTPAGDRRQVTVMFTDLSGFTKLSGRLDPEETHLLLNRFFETVDAIVEEYGGTVDKHIGDNVMAVFGAPIAHGNDPERAIRAALDIHAAMPDLSVTLEHEITVHIGIASGEVVASGTGSSTRQEYTVTGDSVNLAARLDDLAGPGQTLVSDAVYRDVADQADCEEVGTIPIDGFEQPVKVWSVGSFGVRDSQQNQRPFVGRRAEVRQFTGAIEACRETGRGQAVYVRGEAGIGKTRLIEEFRAVAEAHDFAYHSGLVFDFGVGRGQDAIRVIVRSMLAVSSSDDEAARGAVVKKSVAEGLVEAEQEIYLNDLLDLPQPTEFAAVYNAMDNTARNRGKQLTVAAILRAKAQIQPVLVAVEDIHWADPIVLANLAVISDVVAGCPAVLIMASRIEGDPIDHAWRSAARDSPLMTIDLAPLRQEEAIELAGEYFDTANRFAMTCVERAEGNPLFLDQLLRSADEASGKSVPGSVQSIVLARMDGLEPTDKAALQAASVVGQKFSLDLLRQLINSAHYTCAGLVDHVLVRPEGEDFLFSHALVREGVYSSLLKNKRQELHRSAAEWFAGRDPTLHAEHLDRADDPAAAPAYLVAAKVQVEQYRYELARQLVERGLELATDPADRYTLTCFLGQIQHDLGSASDSIDAYERALEFAVDDEMTCRALIGLAAGMRIVDRFDDALAALDKAETIATAHGLTLELAQLHHLRGNLYFPLGNLDGCFEQHELALTYARQIGSTESEARALSGLGDAYYSRGRMKTAFDHFRQCVELCRQHGYGGIEVSNRYMVAWTQLYQNEVRPALDEALSACDAAARVSNHRAEIVARLTAGRVLYEKGDMAEARQQLEDGLRLVGKIGATRFEAFLLIYLSRIVRADGGNRTQALEMANRAVEVSRQTGITFLGPWVLSTLALLSEDPEERRKALAEGEKILDEGCVGHNYFAFYRDAMEVALAETDWDALERGAASLEEYTRAEPLPWADFFIARGRALASYGRGNRDEATMRELSRLRDEAGRVGLKNALSALDEVLAAA